MSVGLPAISWHSRDHSLQPSELATFTLATDTARCCTGGGGERAECVCVSV